MTTSNFQSISYLTTLADSLVVDGSLLALDVSNAVHRVAGVCRISLDDPAGEIKAVAAQGVPLTFAWSINQEMPISLFAGKIADVQSTAVSRVDLVAFNAFNLALTQKFTQTFSNQAPHEILRSLAGALGIPTTGIAEYDGTIKVLPLYRQTLAQAVDVINRTLGVKHDAYVDEDGAFVWAARDYAQDPAFEFEEGVDLLEFNPRESNFVTWGVDLRLRQVVTVLDHEDVLHTLFITGLRHCTAARGSRIEATYEAVP